MASQPHFTRLFAEPPFGGEAFGDSHAAWHPPKASMSAVPWSGMDNHGAILAWDALALWASEPNPFFESWYLLPALRGQDTGGRVKLLRFEIAGELAGLMPVVEASRYYTRPIPHLASWLHPNCFLGAPLVARGLEKPFWRALLDWADAQGGLGLFLHLAELPLSGALYDALREVVGEEQRMAAVVARANHVILRSDLTPDAYFEATVSGKKRKEYRRQANRLAETGALAFTRQRGDEDLADWIESFLALEASGWKGAAGSALASHHATATLWRDALTGAAQRGRLERLAMTLDGRPVAMLASFITAPAAFMFKTTFDESLAVYSPGVLLQRENLAMLEAEGIDWVDSCAGEDHPMITHLWRERRPVGKVSLAIGGGLRRGLFGKMVARELGGEPCGL